MLLVTAHRPLVLFPFYGLLTIHSDSWPPWDEAILMHIMAKAFNRWQLVSCPERSPCIKWDRLITMNHTSKDTLDGDRGTVPHGRVRTNCPMSAINMDIKPCPWTRSVSSAWQNRLLKSSEWIWESVLEIPPWASFDFQSSLLLYYKG